MIFYAALALVFAVSAAICLWQFWRGDLTDEPMSDGWGVRWW